MRRHGTHARDAGAGGAPWAEMVDCDTATEVARRRRTQEPKKRGGQTVQDPRTLKFGHMLTNPDTAGVMPKSHASRHVATLAIRISKPTLGASGRLGWVRWPIGVGLEHDSRGPSRSSMSASLSIVVCFTVFIFAAGVLAAAALAFPEACETAGRVMDTPTTYVATTRALPALPCLSAARPRPRLLPPLSPLAKPLILASLTLFPHCIR